MYGKCIRFQSWSLYEQTYLTLSPMQDQWQCYQYVQQQGQKKKEDISAYEIHGWDSAWLCGLMPFKSLLTWYHWCAWIQLSIVTMLSLATPLAVEIFGFMACFWVSQSECARHVYCETSLNCHVAVNWLKRDYGVEERSYEGWRCPPCSYEKLCFLEEQGDSKVDSVIHTLHCHMTEATQWQ